MSSPSWLQAAQPVATLDGLLGSDFGRHNNLHRLDDDTIAYVVGNAVRIHNVATGSMRYVLGRDGGGVGAVAVHPAKSHIAVAERGNCPNIYVYSWPELKVTGVLREGTERSYSDVNFSASGARLVSVGAFPDFLLTVWDWATQAVVLRTKAFGQEVFNARFNPDDESKLTTSGTGHVRFWRMADTFTGLKLQGDIGKFGRVDLSDIHAFAELPDGKVVTGSEGGMLLMWDGALIKTQIGRSDASNPGGLAVGAHDAPIHVVALDRGLGLCVTGGDDGYVKWWDFKALDKADVLPDGVSIPSVSPVGEASLGGRARVRSIVKLSDREAPPGEGGEAGGRDVTWLITDGSGAVWRVSTHVTPGVGGEAPSLAVQDTEAVLQGHAGPVTGAACSPVAGEPLAATVGVDGTVRCWNTATQQLVLSSTFRNAEGVGSGGRQRERLAATCLAWAPVSADPTGRTLAVGFSDGTLRVLFRGGDEWKRLCVSKPHTGHVVAAAYAPDGRVLATASADGTVFFYILKERVGVEAIDAESAPAELRPALAFSYIPGGFTTLTKAGEGGTTPATALCWAKDGGSLAVGCSDGSVRVLSVPSALAGWPSMQGSLDLDGMEGGPVKLLAALTLVVELVKDAPPPSKEEVEARAKAAVAASKKKDDKSAPVVEEPPPATEVVVPGAPGAVTALAYTSAGRLLLGCAGDGGHQLHELALPKERGGVDPAAPPTPVKPSACYPLHTLLSAEGLHQPRVSCITVLPGGQDGKGGAILVGTTGGSVFVRSSDAPTACVKLALHDSASQEGQGGAPGLRAIAATVVGEHVLLLSCGSDGSLAVLRMPVTCLPSLAGALSSTAALAASMYRPTDVRLALKVGFGSPGVVVPSEGADLDAPPDFLPALSSDPVGVPHPVAPVPEPGAADVWMAAPEHAPTDNTDPAAYSLQQDRMNSAADARAAAAEEHKTKVRRVLAGLREGFAALRARAEAEARIHPSRGLTDADMVLDVGLDGELKAQGMARLSAVDEEHAYERQKRRVTLSKLLSIAVGDLSVDRAAVTGLADADLRVLTLRAQALAPSAAAEIAAAQAEAAAVAHVRLGSNAPPPSSAPVLDPRAGVVSGDLEPPQGAAHKEGKLTKEEETHLALEAISFDSRKAGRMNRRDQLKALKNQRPGPNDEYAPDAAAVAWAQAHMGDFKFKLSKGYALPEGVRLDAPTKRRQILCMEGAVHAARSSFNAKIDTAMRRKRAVVAALVDAHAEVAAIDAELGVQGSVGALLQHCEGGAETAVTELSPPDLVDPACPLATFRLEDVHTALTEEEREGFVTLPALVAQHLADAKAEVALAKARAAALASGATGEAAEAAARAAVPTLSTFHAKLLAMTAALPGMHDATTGAHASTGVAPASPTSPGAHLSPLIASASVDPVASILAPRAQGVEAALGVGGFAFRAGSLTEVVYAGGVVLDAATAPPEAPTTEQVSLARRTARALLCRKAALRGRQVALVEGFDALLRRLRKERLSVVALSLQTSSRAIQLRAELVLLSDMAMKDAALDGRMARAKADKAAIGGTQASLAATLAERKLELDGFAARERALQGEFDETVGSGHSAYSQLLKYYRRKIKRSKGGGGAGGEADAEEDDLDDLGDLGDDDEDDDEEEVCPDGCDKGLYARVLALRERRLDVQDLVEEVNKGLDEVRKAVDRQTQKERQVDRDLNTISAETVSFQREKQGKLNALDTYAVVKLSQITAGGQGEEIPRVPVAGAPPAPVMEEGTHALPSTLDHAVLFNRSALRRLRARIGELGEENARLSLGLKSLKQEERRLAKDKADLEADIAEVRGACNELAVLKFGKVIDLELLDRSTGLSADALSKVVAVTEAFEADAAREVSAVKAKLAKLQDKLTEATMAHTAVLESIATLTARQAALEAELSGRVDKGLTAVALHATLGTPMATGLATHPAVSLAAMMPALNRAGVRLDGGPAGGTSTKRGERKEESLAASASAALNTQNSTASVVAGLTLSGRGGAGKGPVVTDEAAALRQEEEERGRLTALVEAQGRELAELRARVALLKGKASYSKGMEAIASMGATGGGKASVPSGLQSSPTAARGRPAVGMSTLAFPSAAPSPGALSVNATGLGAGKGKL